MLADAPLPGRFAARRRHERGRQLAARSVALPCRCHQGRQRVAVRGRSSDGTDRGDDLILRRPSGGCSAAVDRVPKPNQRSVRRRSPSVRVEFAVMSRARNARRARCGRGNDERKVPPLMMVLDWQTFVLQRRITRPSRNVIGTVANPALFAGGSVLSCDRSGSLRLDAPFRRVDTYAEPVWRAPARLLGSHGRRITAVEIEISAWSAIDTQLLLRPQARNPYRWSGRRMRRYFAHAHRRVDDLSDLLLATTPADQHPCRTDDTSTSVAITKGR